MAGDGEFREPMIPGEGWKFHSLLYAGLLAGSLVSNSLDLLTTWHICSNGGEELNILMSCILSEYGFVALAFYKGWAVSGLLVVLYFCSIRDWRWRGLSLLVFLSVTLLLAGVVAWNGMQILNIGGLRF